MENTPKSTKKKFPGAGRFERAGSTWKWIIYFTNGKNITGYSKGSLYKEPDDKVYALEGALIRLHGSGYFDHIPPVGKTPVKKIEIFEAPLLEDEKLVVICTPDKFYMGSGSDYCVNERLNSFLHRFYECHRKGTVSATLKDKPNGQKETDHFKLSEKRFKNGEELLKHTIYLAKIGYPNGMIMHFHRQYSEKYLSGS